MWVLKRMNADYYYSHYDHRSDLPVYTKDLSKARLYRTKKDAKLSMRFGDVAVKEKDCKGG